MADLFKYSLNLDAETSTLVAEAVAVEAQVVVHVSIWSDEAVNLRIWGSTFLFDTHSGHHSKLVHFENISLAPEWTSIKSALPYRFTLIFEGLPKSCIQFDLIEIGLGEGCFEFKNIMRNQSDVYYVESNENY
ncbi:MAG: hypothetical protein RL516_1095 [Bacteroidota bacterium]|jgi:hypothetical protein